MKVSLTLPCSARLEPLTYTTHPQFLIVGGLRIIEQWIIRAGEHEITYTGPEQELRRNDLILRRLSIGELHLTKPDAEVNPCIVPNSANIRRVLAYVERGVNVRCGGEEVVKVAGSKDYVEDCGIELIKGVWDIVRVNIDLLGETLNILSRIMGIKGPLISIDSQLSGSVILDYREGPIAVIGTVIDVPAYVRGPALIGPSTYIAPFTYVRQGTVTYGNAAISGEVKNTIVDLGTRKEHLGYLGDSYVGKWVNFGAGTTVSNVKNTWGNVKYLGYDTGLRKMGPIIGDWVRTGINTSIMSGKSIGPGSHIYGLVPIDVPPFVIYDGYCGDMVEIDRGKLYEIIARSVNEDEASYAVQIYDKTSSLRVNVKRGSYRIGCRQ